MNLASALISLRFNATGTNGTAGILPNAPSYSPALSLDSVFASGTGASQGNQLWTKQETALAASGTATTRLDNASISDAFGAALTFTSVKALAIVNTGTVDITLGGANGSVPATATPITIPAGGAYVVVNPSAAGWVVGSASTHTIVIVNTSGSVVAKYDLAVLGTV